MWFLFNNVACYETVVCWRPPAVFLNGTSDPDVLHYVANITAIIRARDVYIVLKLIMYARHRVVAGKQYDIIIRKSKVARIRFVCIFAPNIYNLMILYVFVYNI